MTKLNLIKTLGKANISLMDMPSQANGYTATVLIDGTDPNSEEIRFSLEWQIK
jgi:hypothetical protein